VRVSESASTYASPGYLLTAKDGTITAQPFDPTRQRVSGSPSLVASNVVNNAVMSATGGDLLAFGGASKTSKLVWLDRTGRILGAIDAPAHLHNPAFSPDLKQLMASSSDADQRGVWVVDLERGAPTRFVPYGTSPWISPDGQRIVFTSDRFGGVSDMFARSTAGRNDEEVVLRTSENKIVNDWSPDGRYIVYVSTNPVTKKDMWLLPQFGDRKPVPYLQTPANEIQGQVSPDGRWMAYASDESGSWQVYVQTFPVPGRKRVVSVNGGGQPRWRHDGRELFYLAADHTLMAVEVSPGESLEPGRPQALFRADVFGRLNTYRSHYTVTADGQRFLVDSTNGNQPSVTTLVNWTGLIKP
jgi:Tol biopolymer transport system component